ncbi:hypothetical protein CGRA01v4_11880 [Colletotrichum graminicola]|nr:hypothetical protein CGRA01v4_11880 [Colletotrichum graminicola]
MWKVICTRVRYALSQAVAIAQPGWGCICVCVCVCARLWASGLIRDPSQDPCSHCNAAPFPAIFLSHCSREEKEAGGIAGRLLDTPELLPPSFRVEEGGFRPICAFSCYGFSDGARQSPSHGAGTRPPTDCGMALVAKGEGKTGAEKLSPAPLPSHPYSRRGGLWLFAHYTRSVSQFQSSAPWRLNLARRSGPVYSPGL